MTEVRKKVYGDTSYLGTLVDVPDTEHVAVVGAALGTVKKIGEANVFLAGLPYALYQDKGVALADGWRPV